MSYLRTNYMRNAARKVLEKKGFKVVESVEKIPDLSGIDLIARDPEGKNYYIFEFKNAPISTLDVSQFNTSISDLRLSGRINGFIFSDTVPTGSAEDLSEKLSIQIVKIDEKDVKRTVERIASMKIEGIAVSRDRKTP